MHHRVLPDKRADTWAAVVSEAFQTWAPPCVLGSDNGGEFTRDAFASLLREHGVTPWRTTPHTPEQNGKLGHFWGTLIGPEVKTAANESLLTSFYYIKLNGFIVPWD
jgi:transposase InsO family protein